MRDIPQQELSKIQVDLGVMHIDKNPKRGRWVFIMPSSQVKASWSSPSWRCCRHWGVCALSTLCILQQEVGTCPGLSWQFCPFHVETGRKRARLKSRKSKDMRIKLWWKLVMFEHEDLISNNGMTRPLTSARVISAGIPSHLELSPCCRPTRWVGQVQILPFLAHPLGPTKGSRESGAYTADEMSSQEAIHARTFIWATGSDAGLSDDVFFQAAARVHLIVGARCVEVVWGLCGGVVWGVWGVWCGVCVV